MSKIVIGGIYEHFRGRMYQVITLARHSETLSELVIYKSLEDGKTWARPLSIFEDRIPVASGIIDRFRLIKNRG